MVTLCIIGDFQHIMCVIVGESKDTCMEVWHTRTTISVHEHALVGIVGHARQFLSSYDL